MHPMGNFSHVKPRNKSQLLMFLIIEIICLIITNSVAANPASQFSKISRKHVPRPPRELFDHSVQFSTSQARWARALAFNLSPSYHKSTQTHLAGAMNDCIELLDDTLDQLSNVINRKNNDIDDAQTWLSAALTNQDTCIESLENYKFYPEDGINFDFVAQNLSNLITNSLALYMSAAKPKIVPQNSVVNRKLLSAARFPNWVSESEKKLLEASVEEIEAHAVVAKDGSGTHKTIGEALERVVMTSLAGNGRTVIYVKAGTYHENLKIPTKEKNVMLVGDGKDKSVIVGSRNSADGWTTFQSATVAAMGDGFMARDITIVNSAGPTKGQAVALRVGSDKSVVFRCSIIGYQDTLYTHSKRQFYRDTDIYGTVDFIFGNSAVVLQNCNIYVRKPLSEQNNFITAQGRSNQFQNTGISIHNCKILATQEFVPVKSKVKTFLGRPWKQYSRTVIMQSFLDDLVHPTGWSPWSGSFAIKTLYYGEYMNSGPGSSTSGRVKWPGFHASLASAEAEKFTVAGFIAGNLWLPSTGVSFVSGLL